MVKENFFEGKKNVVISFITIFLILVGVFFVSAYISGKNVTDDVRLQWVSHTEYWNNDDASSIIRLADYKGNAYSVDSCVVTILYPDKSVFVSEGVMSESNIDGNWYRTDSLIVAPLGTYEQEVVCVKGQQTVKSSQSFHLNPALEEVNTVSQNLNLLNDSLFVFDVEINGVLEDTNESIHTRVNVAENNLDAAIDLAQQNVLDELASHGVDSDASFSSLNATVLSRIDDLDVSPLEQLLRDPSTGGVYYAKDGKKYPIVNPEIIDLNYPDLTITNATPEQLTALRKLLPVKIKDGTLVISEKSNQVYVIADGKRRWVSNEQTFIELGYSWANIKQVSDRVLKLHKVGEQLSL